MFWAYGPGGRRRAMLLLVAALAGACDSEAAPRQTARRHARTSAGDPLVRRRVTIGRSVRGRPITVVELGDPDAPARVLVVEGIHGDETGGRAITRGLEHARPPGASMLWIVDELNPDGIARGTRQNARGVDLNRNFPWRWRPLGHPGDPQYSGVAPLSEPESQAAHRLILTIRPRVTIWFHQPLAVTDRSGGEVRVERRFAALSGLPLRRLTRYPGSAAGWQDHGLPESTAFVVELPPGRPLRRAVRRYETAVRGVAGG